MKNPPNKNEFEVVFFGPGYGESILVFAPDYGWIVIDSCNHENKPVALAYLESIGFDPRNSIKHIVISHFHDDHIIGLAETILRCPQANVWYPAPIMDDTFIELATAADEADDVDNGLKEICRIFKAIQKNQEDHGQIFRQVLENTEIYSCPNGILSLKALSPSSNTLDMVRNVIKEKQLIKKATLKKKDLNFTSIVIWAKIGGVSFLFGSDLQVHKNNNLIGWERVLKIFPTMPALTKSDLFKIPHHGSHNGDHPNIWSDLVNLNPKSICTRFINSALPRRTDIARIKSKSSETYITSLAKDKHDETKALLEAHGVETESSVPKDGCIRLRFCQNSSPSNIRIELFGSASKL